MTGQDKKTLFFIFAGAATALAVDACLISDTLKLSDAFGTALLGALGGELLGNIEFRHSFFHGAHSAPKHDNL